MDSKMAEFAEMGKLVWLRGELLLQKTGIDILLKMDNNKLLFLGFIDYKYLFMGKNVCNGM